MAVPPELGVAAIGLAHAAVEKLRAKKAAGELAERVLAAIDPTSDGGTLRRFASAPHGLRLGTGVSPEAITRFERERCLRIPADMATFYRTTDGSEEMTSETLVRICPLQEVHLAEWAPAGEHGGRCFVFADYLISSIEFGILLSDDPSAPTPISRCCGTPEPIATSWTEFLELILGSSPILAGADV